MSANCLISTVGTSLFANIKGQFNEGNGISKETHDILKEHLAAKQWSRLASELVKIPPAARICGAEINSIDEAVRRGRVTLNHLCFLVSDTEDGKNMGKLLENYYIERGLKDIQSVDSYPIEGLQDENPARFRTFGLRNLVRQIGDLVEKYGAERIIIDATGGYKAQIAIAVVFGQALSIPVLYRHERFSEIITIPPMPISFDYSILGENAGLLARFERNDTLTLNEIHELDDKIRVLLEEYEIDGENVFGLGAVGQIYLTGFRAAYPRDRQLPPVKDGEKTPPRFRDDHYPNGFKPFVEKVCREVAWIKTAHSLPYHKQKAIKGDFYAYEGKLVGTYRNDYGARFEILTSVESPTAEQLAWAADQLNQLYWEQ
ncbi:MAG TPA: putative CRISPR-associated protein [Aggregatilineales bacterium]|nr:putative CRISPR-associated protein [Anaerolineales bacterium]HRE46684.1 putative CRISPR-associated protein [Aggregatilineales bacterium]